MVFVSHSIFQTQLVGPLSSRRKTIKRKRMTAVVMLTSLIDAFSILVVYLLMFFSNTGEMTYVNSDIDLPKASMIERLDRYSILQIKKEGYFVEERKLTRESLVPYLVSLKKKIKSIPISRGRRGIKEKQSLFRQTKQLSITA